tara:strand:- start:171 stop:500 length:330 start_codon:yes stop_codon:yes gene_type:complete
MTNKKKIKGDAAEREAADILTEALGYECTRTFCAGMAGDIGDIHGIPDTVCQVANWADRSAACLQKPREVEQQRLNAKAKRAFTMVRFRGGKNNWRVVMTVEQFARFIK